MKSRLCLPLLAVSVCACVQLTPTARGDSPPAVSPRQERRTQSSEPATITIPGPLRSFLRMSGISQKVSPEEVTPLLARKVFLRGYEGPQPKRRRTEFLILLSRYVQQARELALLAGTQGVLHASGCEEAKPLLLVLGYRARPDCGQRSTYLETADAQRAFLTIDSGFPLPELEKALQEGKPFSYAFPTSSVPVLFTESDWSAKGNGQDLLDTLLNEPALARLYWAVSRMDVQTRAALRQSPGLKKLLPFAAVLDFYGSHIRIRSGRVVVPGGSAAESGWKDLLGVSPESPEEFILRLLTKDNGWLAAYFDSLSRVSQVQQAHFADPRQLRGYYEALRGKDTSPDAARPVFRPGPGLLLLATRLHWEPNGDPHVPGNLEVWRKILRQKTESHIVRGWSRRTGHLGNPGQLLEAMFALSRVQTEAGPLQSYLLMSEIDARRPREHRLSPETVALLATKFSEFSSQYLIFSEFPNLDDASIASFLSVATGLNAIPNHNLRGNALGIFQATIGMWQVLARQRQIPSDQLNGSWQQIIKPFGKIASSAQLFDASRSSLKELMLASTGRADCSQNELIDLLAGPHEANPEGQRVHEALANKIRSVLDAQRLVSLDTVLALGDGLREASNAKLDGNALIPLAGELREFEMPRPIFRSSERAQWAAGIYNNRHTEMQMRTDLTKIIKSPSSPEQLAEARGQLVSFLRDTLVGLNYAYYEPPGAHVLHHNPLFVRSHDFSGDTVAGTERRIWQAPELFGAGSPAGGGARLVGSLADLPYVLAEVEQDFIAPENVQALIWREVVPGLLTDAIVPRWWGVSRNELHAVALYQRAGEELLTAAAQNEALRNRVMNALSERMAPQHAERLEQALRTGGVAEVLPQLMPADTFYLAAEYRRKYPEQAASFGPAGKELESLSQRYPAEVSWERLSRDFGVPHPVLAQSYARELLNLAPLPTFMGYSSRFLAESWDSNNLYWARLADENGYAPVMMNRLVPELTRRMVEKIFATDLEDWPALLRAARETADEFRQGKITSLSGSGGPTSSQP